jgi:hypothetical protein
MPSIALTCHPSTPCEAIRRFEARVRRTPEGMLALTYSIEGDLAGIRVPGPASPRRADGLWRHTCCEAFLAEPGLPAYYEFNFAPSAEWAFYRFEAYRTGMADVATARSSGIILRRDAHSLELETVIDLNDPPAALADAGLRLALSAVIEAVDGRLSYWALAHPPGKPDFHHPDSFALTLDPPVRP